MKRALGVMLAVSAIVAGEARDVKRAQADLERVLACTG